MARRAWAGCGIPYHCALTLHSAGAGGAEPWERWGRPEIPGHARRDHPEDSRSTAPQAQMGKPRLREARSFLKGPQLGRGRAGTRILLETPLLAPSRTESPSNGCSFCPGAPAVEEEAGGWVSCTPTKDAKPWLPSSRLFLWAAFPREGPKRKSRLLTDCYRIRAFPGSGAPGCDTSVRAQQPSGPISVTLGRGGGRGSDKTRCFLPAVCLRPRNLLSSSSIRKAGASWLGNLMQG